MRCISRLLLVAVLFTGLAFAHGDEQHVMGTVTAISGDFIKVLTKPKGLVVVYIRSETKYEKSGEAANVKDLRVGERVVIHAAKMNDKLVATEVRFGAKAPTPANPQPRGSEVEEKP